MRRNRIAPMIAIMATTLAWQCQDVKGSRPDTARAYSQHVIAESEAKVESLGKARASELAQGTTFVALVPPAVARLVSVKPETVFVHDTLPPVRDTVKVLATVRVRDTVRLPAPTVRVAVVSDSTRLFGLAPMRGPAEGTRDAPVRWLDPAKPKRWCLSLGVGFGVTTGGRVGIFAGPAITRTVACW